MLDRQTLLLAALLTGTIKPSRSFMLRASAYTALHGTHLQQGALVRGDQTQHCSWQHQEQRPERVLVLVICQLDNPVVSHEVDYGARASQEHQLHDSVVPGSGTHESEHA